MERPPSLHDCANPVLTSNFVDLERQLRDRNIELQSRQEEYQCSQSRLAARQQAEKDHAGAEKEHTAALVEQRQRAWRAFERNVDEEIILLVPFSPAIFKKANHLLESCHPQVPLRSLDALHLASSDHLQDWPLCTTDKRMREAATLLRFPLAGIP